MIVNSGVRRVVYKHGYPDDFAREMLAEGGVALERFSEEDVQGVLPPENL